MAPTPPPRSQPPRRPAAEAHATPGERLWRSGFFYASAVMGAMALVDFDAGRLAHGLGDAGIACLMLSLMTQFPFVRAVMQAGGREAPEQARQALLHEAEKLRAEHPWADRLNRTGWMLLLTSLALRLLGAA
ncbi:MAG: hypothetical protein MUC68_01970 [Burkholderiaceae bacterium]|jgi:hypothetical protein|nr:hypothetical protein [Burkholderiaceae bacterium]